LQNALREKEGRGDIRRGEGGEGEGKEKGRKE